MKLSQEVWQRAEGVVQAIKEHPFNRQLCSGELSRERFAYYIEQDSLYLQDFARAHALLAARLPLEHVRMFLQFAEHTFIAEQEVVHQYFRNVFEFSPGGGLSPATLCYTSYLLRCCALEEVAVGLAAMLPCFWVYREVGDFIAAHSSEANPYERWIATYSSPEYSQAVEQAIGVFDHLAAAASSAAQQAMREAFQRSCLLEWHFWNDAYRGAALDKLS